MTGMEIVRQAWQGLREHGLPASLSGLGVVFGVATVVAALAVGEGARRRSYEEVGALGIDNLFVRARPAPGQPPPARFTPGDLAAIQRYLGEDAVVAGARRAAGDVRQRSTAIAVEVAGVTPAWREVADLEMADGRWLSETDVRERRRVMVLTSMLARSLFSDTISVGEYVRWRDDWFVVIGVLKPVRRVEERGAAYIPISAAAARLGSTDDGRGVQEIALRSFDGADAEWLAREAARVLATRGHREDAFDLVVPRALLRAKLEAQRTFDWVLMGIGGLALAISGIGIMNIMLASVVARTAEIGLRRAAGARRRDVLAQFAAEAALLCLGGGLAGVPLGACLAALIAAGAGWPVAISLQTIGLSLATAAAVGLTSGIYPARRAARLDPVVALRS